MPPFLLVKTMQPSNAQDMFAHGIARLVGRSVPRDLADARYWMRKAADLGHADAAHIEIALCANGTGAPADWGDAFHRLTNLPSADPQAQRALQLLDRMAIDEEGHPSVLPVGEVVSDTPNVRVFRQFLTTDECAHIAMSVQDILEPASVVDPKTGKAIRHPIRISSDAVVGPTREDLVIRAINHRIAAITGTRVEQGEPLTILNYGQGQEYRPHFDSIPGESNQRITTVILYLNDNYQGGETHFLHNGLRLKGGFGDAIVFSNVLPDGRPDPRTQHAGLPVTAGVKWIATRWIRHSDHDIWAR